MSTLSDIRSQVYSLLKETSGDSNFTDAQINSFINQTQSLIAPLIELPRKQSSGTQVTEGMGSVTLPTDNILILDAYIGDTSLAGDMKRLIVVKEQVIPPTWMDTNTSSRGEPTRFFQQTLTNGIIYPRANANAAATDKKVYFDYVYKPADLSSDSESPSFPLPYQDIIKFYVLYLCYLTLGNSALAQQFKNDFIEHHKVIQSASTKETREGFSFQWTYGISDDEDMILNVQ
jgi:hypothetical protein